MNTESSSLLEIGIETNISLDTISVFVQPSPKTLLSLGDNPQPGFYLKQQNQRLVLCYRHERNRTNVPCYPSVNLFLGVNKVSVIRFVADSIQNGYTDNIQIYVPKIREFERVRFEERGLLILGDFVVHEVASFPAYQLPKP